MPMLTRPRRRRSSDPDLFWQILCLCVIGVVLVVAGVL